MGALCASHHNFHLYINIGASRHNAVAHSIELRLVVLSAIVEIGLGTSSGEQLARTKRSRHLLGSGRCDVARGNIAR